jgi:bacterioferritin
MKGDPEIIAMLNARLADEHAGIVQYVTHAGMLDNWGYARLAAYILDRAKSEMRHAGLVLDRILFLDGTPDLAIIHAVNIGADVEEMFANDQDKELTAIAGYTEGVDLAVKLKDFGTRDLMEKILIEEDDHLNVIEGNITQIGQIGINSYLAVQIEG